MADYSPITDFSIKDGLVSGNPAKLIVGADFDAEFDAIATAVATKYDSGDLANQAQAELETANDVVITPLRLANWADYNAGLVGDLQALTDPNADRLFFWDDSAGALVYLTIATGLEVSGTSLILDIDALTNVTPVAGDEIVVADASDTGLPKAVLLSALATFMNTELQGTLVHDSLTGFVANEHIDHTTVSVTAGTGLSGGGTIAANRTLNLDISGLTAIAVDGLAATDGFLVDDAGTMKRISVQSLGVRVEGSSTQTLALDDSGKLFVNTGASEHTITIPLNASVAFPVGTEVGLVTQSTGKIAVAATGGVTLTSLNSYKDVKASGGGAYLVKTATDVWSLIGDLEL